MKFIITFLILIILVESAYIYYNTTQTPETTIRIIKVGSPNYIVKTDTQFIIKPFVIDTQIIIKKYFEKINFNREIKFEDLKIRISDTLYYNTLHLGDAIITRKERIKYFAGVNYNVFNGVGVGVALQKKKFIYEFNYYPKNNIFELGVKYRIDK